MSEHISFERLYNFAFSDGSDAQFNKEADEINEHIFNCDECYETYKLLDELRDSIDALTHLTDLQADIADAVGNNCIDGYGIDFLTDFFIKEGKPDFCGN